jgi:putative DNA primase/helicase
MSSKEDDNNLIRLAEYQKKGGGVISEHNAALAFTEQHRGQLLYEHLRGAWYQWLDNYWRCEETALVLDLARAVAARLIESEDDKTRRVAGRHSFTSGVEKFARADRAFAITSTDFDRDDFLIGTTTCENEEWQ